MMKDFEAAQKALSSIQPMKLCGTGTILPPLNRYLAPMVPNGLRCLSSLDC